MEHSPNHLTETIKVRRPIKAYVFHGLWMVMTLYQTLTVQSTGRYWWGIFFIGSVIVLIRFLMKHSYLEKVGSTLTVNGDLFKTSTIDIADIEKIEVAAGPFSNSRIILKEKKGSVKFNYYNVNDGDFNELIKSLDVPVE